MYSLIHHGRRSIELQKWLRLSVSLNPLQNAFAFSNPFSSASGTAVSCRDGRKGNKFTVSYLVDSLGFTRKLAESISKKVSFEDKGNPDSVLNLLRSHGFTDSQISTIIRDYPGLLILDVEKSLGPKLKFLQSRGASISELTQIVSKVPKILGKKEENTIRLYYDFVKDILHEEEANNKNSKYEKLSLSSPQGKQENKIRNVSVLREMGVPQRLLISLLISNYQPVCGKEKFEESLKKVVEMGFDPTKSKFVKALHVFYQLGGETIEEKVEVYKRLGFTVDDVWAIFKKWPFSLKFSEKKINQTVETLKKCGLNKDETLQVLKKYPQFIRTSEEKILGSIETFLSLGFSRDEFTMMVKRYPPLIGLSEEMVKKKTDYFMKKMNWPQMFVVSSPAGLGYSMEKRIVPRCNVIKALMSKGLLGSELPSMSSVLTSTDQAFLNVYVMKNNKQMVPKLMAIYNGHRVS